MRMSGKAEGREDSAQDMLGRVCTEVVDVLSTQSIRAPEVVKGIKESIGAG